MHRMTRLRFFWFLPLLLVAGLLPALAQVPAANVAELRLVNAMIGLGNLDLYLNGRLIQVELPPESASPYFTLPAGRHRVEARMAGSEPLTTPVASDIVDLAPNSAITTVIYQSQFDNVRPPDFVGAGAIFSQAEDRSPIQLGHLRLSAIHLAAGAPERLSIGFPSRASVLYQVGYAQPYGTVDFTPGIYRLTVLDGTTPEQNILYRAGEVNLFAGSLYTVVVVPDVQPGERSPSLTSQPRFFLISTPLDAPRQGVSLRIMHAAPNTDVVDVYVDERLVASRLSFGQHTDYIGLEPYSHVVALRPYNAAPDSPALARLTMPINAENAAQKNWSLLLLNAVATNEALGQPLILANENPAVASDDPIPSRRIATRGGPIILALTPDDISQTQGGFARVRLVHALANFPALTLNSPVQPFTPGIATATPRPNTPPPGPRELVPDTEFGFIAGEEEVPAGVYEQVNVQVAATGLAITGLGRQQLLEGQVYTYVIAASPNPNEPPRVFLIVDHGRGISARFNFAGQLARNQVNVREQATVNSVLLATLSNNAGVIVLGRDDSGEWIRVRFSNPTTGRIQEGWMSASLLIVTRQGARVNINTLPVVD